MEEENTNKYAATVKKRVLNESIIVKQYSMFFIQNDLRNYFDLVEKNELKDEIEKKLNLNIYNKKVLKDVLIIFDYITELVVKIYSQPLDVLEVSENVVEEAEFVVKEFIKSYYEGKEKKEYSFNSLIPNSQKKARIDIIRKKLKKINKFNGAEINNFDQFFTWINEKGNLNKLIKRLSKTSKLSNEYQKAKSYLEAFYDILWQANSDIKNFGKKYNIKLNDEAEMRCLFNSFNLFLHFVFIYGKVIVTEDKRELIFAAAAIHPVEDDFIDSEIVSEDVFDIVTQKLKGANLTSPNEKIKNIFSLIDVIYDYYPPQKNPQLVDIFTQLNYWQYQSIRQKSYCNEKDILKISLMKGGYAFALFGYIITGKMSGEAFRHFFSMGAIFQLMDDIHDIEDDLQNKILTLCTQSYINNGNIDEVMKGVIEIQRKYDMIVPLVKDVRYPILLRRLEHIAVRFDAIKFSCINNKYFTENYLKELDNNLPVDISEAIYFFKRKVVLRNVDDYLVLLEKLKYTFENLQ